MMWLFWLVACIGHVGPTAAPTPPESMRRLTTGDTGCAEPRATGTPDENGCVLGPVATGCANGDAVRGIPQSECPTFEEFLTDVGWVAWTLDGRGYYAFRCGLDMPYDVVQYIVQPDVGLTDEWYFDVNGGMVAYVRYPWYRAPLGELECCGDGAADGRDWYGPPVGFDCSDQITHEYSTSEFPGGFPGYPEPADTGEAPSGGCGGCGHGDGLGGGLGSLLVAAAVTARRRRRR